MLSWTAWLCGADATVAVQLQCRSSTCGFCNTRMACQESLFHPCARPVSLNVSPNSLPTSDSGTCFQAKRDTRSGHDHIDWSRRDSTSTRFVSSRRLHPPAFVYSFARLPDCSNPARRAMPHSTSHSTGAGSTSHIRATSHTRSSHSRSSSTVRPNAETNGGAGQETEKFPDFDVGHVFPSGQSTGGSRWQNGFGNGGATNSSDRWHARRDSRVKWAPTGPPSGAFGHTRKASSINNAIHRMRSGSMSQNAHKIADALHAPFSWKLVVCSCPAHHSYEIVQC